jgi:hypothetical protein
MACKIISTRGTWRNLWLGNHSLGAICDLLIFGDPGISLCEVSRRSHVFIFHFFVSAAHCLSSLLPQLVGFYVRVKDGNLFLVVGLYTVVLDHAAVDPNILALDRDGRLGHDGVEHKVVIAMRAVLIGLLKLLGVLAEALFALFAGKRHFKLLEERVALLLLVAFGAVEPFSAYFVFMV